MNIVTSMKVGVLILVLMTFSLMGSSFQAPELGIEVKIFQVPAYQSIVSSVPSPPREEGVVQGIRGTRTGGYVTGFFPDGIVLIETDLCNNHEDIIRVIRKKVMSTRPDWVQILPLADAQVRFDRDSLDGFVTGGRNYPQRHKHLEINFEAIPFAVRDEEIVVKAIFILKETTGYHVIHVGSRVYMIFFNEHTDNFALPLLYSIIIDIFSSPSEPISPYLGCCGGFAVDHSFTRRAYHLRQTRLVNYPG